MYNITSIIIIVYFEKYYNLYSSKSNSKKQIDLHLKSSILKNSICT